MTEWRDVTGYKYEVSDDGSVLSLLNNRLVKAHANHANGANDTGYLQVRLKNNKGRTEYHFVHRLVAAAFIGPCPPRQCVNHKNGNKLDNRAVNLEYCTYKENMDHALVTGLIPSGERHYLSKFTDTTASQIVTRFEQGGISMRQLAREYGVAVSTIRRMVRGITWKILRTQ